MRRIASFFLAAIFAVSAMAQAEVNSTTLLDIAPYRHNINPAFEPLTNGYFYIPVLSHIGLNVGNNSLSMSSLIVNHNGQTMWTLNPNSPSSPLDDIRKNMLINANINMDLLGFGFRTKKNGYFHLNLSQRVDAGVTLPKDLFGFVLGGGMNDLEGTNTYNLASLGLQAQTYTEIAAGYSHHTPSNKWTWGVKVKALLGEAYAGMSGKKLRLDASSEAWDLNGTGQLRIAAPLSAYPSTLDGKVLFGEGENKDGKFDWANSLDFKNPKSYVNGIGFAADMGFVFKPIKYLSVAASLTDVGFIKWFKGMKYNYTIDGHFNGVGEINYGDYTNEEGQFDSQRLTDTLTTRLTNVAVNALHTGEGKNGFSTLLTMKLNASVEGHFFNDAIGVGLYSSTMLYNSKLYEELTLGAYSRPTSWFNLGVTYSLLNGKWSNLGVGLGLRGGPFVLSLAADYVPTTFAALPSTGKMAIPYKTKGINVELGLGIVWGWKPKKTEVAATDF